MLEIAIIKSTFAINDVKSNSICDMGVLNLIGQFKPDDIIRQIQAILKLWPDYANQGGVAKQLRNAIKKHLLHFDDKGLI